MVHSIALNSELYKRAGIEPVILSALHIVRGLKSTMRRVVDVLVSDACVTENCVNQCISNTTE